MDERKYRQVVTGILMVIALILVGSALRATMAITMPLAVAFFLAVLIRPIEHWLHLAMPRWLRWLSLPLTMAMILAVLAAVVVGIGYAASTAADAAPELGAKLQQQWDRARQWLRDLGVPMENLSVQDSDAQKRIIGVLTSSLASIWWLMGAIGLVFFMTLLILMEGGRWRQKTEETFNHRWSKVVLDTVSDIAVRVRRYLWVTTLVGLMSGTLGGLFLWLMGVPYAPLWGVLLFLSNFIPTVGAIVAGLLPTLLALVQDGLLWGLLVGGGILAIESIMGNFVAPKMQGKSLEISPFVVLLSIVFWGWVWGIPGALLAVPMTSSILILCEHVPSLRPVATMLGRASDDDEPSDK